MLAAGRRWLRRHRTSIAVGLGVVGAGYLAAQFVVSKITEAKDRMLGDRAARENLRRRFEQNQQDCTLTVVALLSTATENIFEALPVEQLTAELQQRKSKRRGDAVDAQDASTGPGATGSMQDSPSFSQITSDTSSSVATTPIPAPVAAQKKSRSELWHELKITNRLLLFFVPAISPLSNIAIALLSHLVSALTRTFTIAYTLSLLTLLTRIQLNLLGKQAYLASVIALASPAPKSSPCITLKDHDEGPGCAVDQKYGAHAQYLAFSWWLLHTGCTDLMAKVKGAVTEVFEPLSPRESISKAQLCELTLEVRRRIEGGVEKDRRSVDWLPYLLPPKGREEFVLRESGVLPAEDTTTFEMTTDLLQLLDETSDLIESPQFSHVLTLLNNEAFSLLIDEKCATEFLSSSLNSQDHEQQQQQEASLFMAKAKLASILAVMSQQSYVIGNGTEMPNEYLSAMEQRVMDLDAFAAVIYSSNLDVDIESRAATPEMAKPDKSGTLSNGGDGDGNGLQRLISDMNDGNSRQSSLMLQSDSSSQNASSAIDNAFEQAWNQASSQP